MRHAPKIALLILLLAALFQVPAQAESVSFVHLDKDREIVATLWTWGCFHYRAKYQLVFRSDPERPGGAIVERRDVKGLWHRRLVTLTLGAEDLRSLDAGVDRYREHNRGGCISTNQNRIKLKLQSGGDIIAQEMYFGNTCDVHLVPGALDLADIVFRRDVGTEVLDTRLDPGLEPPAVTGQRLNPHR